MIVIKAVLYHLVKRIKLRDANEIILLMIVNTNYNVNL